MSKINYDLTLIKGIVFDIDGVLSPATVPLGPDGIPCRMANLRDGYAMVRAVKAGLKIAIISGAFAPGLRERFSMIGLAPGDIFLDTLDKLPVLQQWAADNGFSAGQIAYVGDDIPDVPALRWCGLPATPADGAVECKALALFIADSKGGYGVGREIVEEVMRAQGIWPVCSDATGI